MNHKMDIILNDIFDMEQPESEEVVEDIQVIEGLFEFSKSFKNF